MDAFFTNESNVVSVGLKRIEILTRRTLAKYTEKLVGEQWISITESRWAAYDVGMRLIYASN